MHNTVLTINIPLESLFIELEEKIEAAICKAIKAHSEVINNNNIQVDLLSRKEACLLLGISLPTLSKYVASGKLPHSRIGKKVLFDKNLVFESLSKVKRTK